MAYLAPAEFVTKMVDAGESKLLMSTRDTLIRSYMVGAILALAAAFAVTITVNTGNALVGAMLFPERERFVNLKTSGQLDSPDQAGAKVLKFLARADYGETPVADVRDA